MKKRILGFLSGALALTLVVGSWAYYTSTVSVDNKLQTAKYGDELVEKFTPKNDWQPGQQVTKEVGVENTGDYALLVRIKMSEVWSRTVSGVTTNLISHDSTQAGFTTATATSATQGSPTDGLLTGDQSVVYKALAASGWTYNLSDGYWYYNSVLAAGAGTGPLLSSITLAGNTDMGKYTTTKYYTTATTKPANDLIGSNPATHWVAYGVLPTDPQTVPNDATFTRSVSVLSSDAGYAGAEYVLTITSETLQATAEALAGTSSWGTAPSGVVSGWGL